MDRDLVAIEKVYIYVFIYVCNIYLFTIKAEARMDRDLVAIEKVQ